MQNENGDLNKAISDIIEKTQKSTSTLGRISENNTTFISKIKDSLIKIQESVNILKTKNFGEIGNKIKELTNQLQQQTQELNQVKSDLALNQGQTEQLMKTNEELKQEINNSKSSNSQIESERNNYQNQLHELIKSQQPLITKIGELNVLIDQNIQQLEVYANDAVDPSVINQIQEVNNAIEDVLSQVNTTNVTRGGRRRRRTKKKSQRKRKKLIKTKRKRTIKGGWKYKEDDSISSYSKTISSSGKNSSKSKKTK